MSLEQSRAFMSGGGWLQEMSDYSNEVNQETCFFPSSYLTGKETMTKMDSLKSVKEIKTSFIISDMSLLHNLQEVEMDAQVPVYKEPITLMDLSGQLTPTIEVLTALENAGPGGPLGLLSGGMLPSAEVVHNLLTQDQDPCLGSSNLHNMSVNETFQDLSDLLDKDCRSPAASTCTTLDTVYSPASLSSGLSSPAHFFDTTPTSEEYKFPSTILQLESQKRQKRADLNEERPTSPYLSSYPSSSKDNRYCEMRKKNNIASKRSRQTRREKEIENEQRVKDLETDNENLRAKVAKLEELTNSVKAYLIKSVSQKK